MPVTPCRGRSACASAPPAPGEARKRCRNCGSGVACSPDRAGADDMVIALDHVLGGVLARQDDARRWLGLRTFVVGDRAVLVDAAPPALTADPRLARAGVTELPTWSVAVDGDTVLRPATAHRRRQRPDVRRIGVGVPLRIGRARRARRLQPRRPRRWRRRRHGRPPADHQAVHHPTTPGALLARFAARHPSNEWFHTVEGLVDGGCVHATTDRAAAAEQIRRLLARRRPDRLTRETTVDTRTFDAHGVTFTISSPDADVVAAFDDLLVDFRSARRLAGAPSVRFAVEATRPDGTEQTWYRVTADDEVVYTSLLEGSLVSHLLMDVNARAAAACRDDGTVPLHAGTVAGAHGAIVLPGASHSGKTTITTALAAAGHRFVADEVSRLDPDDLTIAPVRQAGGVAVGIGGTVGADHRPAPPSRKSLRDRRTLRPSLRTRPRPTTGGGPDRRWHRHAAGRGVRHRVPPLRRRRAAPLRSARPGRDTRTADAVHARRRLDHRSAPTCSASSNGSCAPCRATNSSTPTSTSRSPNSPR